MNTEYHVLAFKSAQDWRAWLDAHHTTCDGLWLRLYKKASGATTVTYAEALDDALCYGWIDGQKKSYDDVSFLQKFTPRRTRSMWSKRNIEHIVRLTKSGMMMPAGLAEVEQAKADGRWESAYDSARSMTIPEDFLTALKQNKKASAFFETLTKTSLYAIGFRLQTAKKTRNTNEANRSSDSDAPKWREAVTSLRPTCQPSFCRCQYRPPSSG